MVDHQHMKITQTDSAPRHQHQHCICMVNPVAMKHSRVRIISRGEAKRQLNEQEPFQNVACENAVDAARQSPPRRLGLPSKGTVGGNHDQAGAATAVHPQAQAPCAHMLVCVLRQF
jgi:hypothetical protein